MTKTIISKQVMPKAGHNMRRRWSLLAGGLMGLLAMLVTMGLAAATQPAVAAPLPQDGTPLPPGDAGRCATCHLDITQNWERSSHAHAFDDPNFQERWTAMGSPANCLVCHTTGFQATGATFDAAGVSCEGCHGQVDPNHPKVPAPIRSDAEYCGTCHTTTLGEWRLTGHSAAGISCNDCHDPHSQKALFSDPDEMCLNCHQDSMGDYLEDIHIQKGIGCVDCHALVIPPEVEPKDGIVPTGHTFTITPATCVACHTDALHAGFSLPGYENGAKAGNGGTDGETKPVQSVHSRVVQSPDERIQLLENQLQTYEASIASRNMTILFQGGVVGLVLGGSTAWIVARNLRNGRKEENGEEQEANHEKDEK